MIVFPTGVTGVELCEVPEDDAPCLDFCLRVVDMGQWLSMTVVVGKVGKVLATSAVHGVSESGMVGVQLTAIGQDLVCEAIQVTDATREPRNSSCIYFYKIES